MPLQHKDCVEQKATGEKNKKSSLPSRLSRVLVAQLCPTLCNPMDCHLPGSSVTFSRQEHRRGLPFPSPGDLPNPGIEPRSLAFQAYSLTSEPRGSPKAEHKFIKMFPTHNQESQELITRDNSRPLSAQRSHQRNLHQKLH